MPQVKICGVTTLQDALAAAQAGAAFIGLNFYKPGPRYIEPASAAVMAAERCARTWLRMPAARWRVRQRTTGHTAGNLRSGALDFVQLCGAEPPQLLAALHGRAFKAIRPQSVVEARALATSYAPSATRDERAPALLLDAYHPALYGGTGTPASRE
ncbi:N-(5'-phosphoribosyl)anthranilate isomerase, partial [Chloroflexota bacterium]